VKRRKGISVEAYSTLTRPLINKDGTCNRSLVMTNAHSRKRAGVPWRGEDGAIAQAWRLARRQQEQARAFDELRAGAPLDKLLQRSLETERADRKHEAFMAALAAHTAM
jgi:hypothetical protein